MIKRVLRNETLRGSGQVRDRFRDWVIYNAAMFLYAGGRAPSIAEGVPLAKKALDSGAAAQKLADLASPPASLGESGQTATTPEEKVVHA